MIDTLKKLFVFGLESRLEKAVATVESAAAQAPVQAMQSIGDWLTQELRRAEGRRDGLAVLRAIDARLRSVLEDGMSGMLEAKSNHARMNLLLQTTVPFCATIAEAYTETLRRDMVELARKPANAPLVQASVCNWLYWIGREHVVRFVREPKTDKLPWHEIRPAAEFALGLGGTFASRIARPDGESGRLQKQLSYLVLLSRTLTSDLQGRQLLIADRVADILASFIMVSDQHSSQTPFGQASDDDNPPTVLTKMPTQARAAGHGLFYGLEKTLLELVALEKLIGVQNKVPTKMDPAGRIAVAETLVVIKHLKNRWAGRDVKRQAERKPISGTLTICYDFSAIRRMIGQTGVAAPTRSNETTLERAVVEDVSASGVGLKLSKHTGWASMGMLLGVKTDKDNLWRVAIIRRLINRAQGEVMAGIQFMAREPESIRLTRRANVSQWEKVTEHHSWDNLLAIYLRPEPLNDNLHLLIVNKAELELGKTYGAPGTREGDLFFRVVLRQEIGADCVFYRVERVTPDAKPEQAAREPGAA
ncbi:hypothetical protein FNU76_22190 [Chitinimonas arctica]|uniref:PilZ domain-containing protein n=1 Tax=Chitinimonas arctica TaxID=2594795 RepID=A0A516SL10_9NEIS|nr:hypothetical protein [Chitinimonas arctica]QDQ28839.1 hypothetical protein FNU76_22190 [Chitinimonas arctica]